MKKNLITFKTAKLAKEKGFDIKSKYWYDMASLGGILIEEGSMYDKATYNTYKKECAMYAPTQDILKKFIREKRGVHIEILRNASGYYWSMCKSDSGTDLGWSESIGPNPSGVWDEYEDALEHAMFTQLSLDLAKFGHWGNYVGRALKSIK